MLWPLVDGHGPLPRCKLSESDILPGFDYDYDDLPDESTVCCELLLLLFVLLALVVFANTEDDVPPPIPVLLFVLDELLVTFDVDSDLLALFIAAVVLVAVPVMKCEW